MNRLLLSLVAFAFAATALTGAADAKSCRGASGKFVKCPPAAMATKTPASKKACRGANGKFIKCPK